jgi:DNA polymerase-3 subunit epsilon
LSRSLRTSLASIRTAIETVMQYPDMEDEQQERFKKIIHQESVNLSRVLEETAGDYSRYVKSHWPLVSVSSHELAEALHRKAAQKLGLQVDIDAGQQECWIKIDSYAFTLVLLFLLRQVQQCTGAKRFSLRIFLQDCLTGIDLVWSGGPIEQKQIRQWEAHVLTVDRDSLPLTLADVISHHQAEIWSYSDTSHNRSYLRIVLPAGDSCRPETAGGLTILPGSRPEYFDFDLFNQPGQTPDLDNRSLAELSYTVFDTETTGLNPRQGDEIIAIGAVRIINGRLLRNESFDQLIDPQRPIPHESIQVHGIQPEMLKGQPTIETVLPFFHRFCEGTILVAHNAAFDMQMLKMKETRTGVKFINPVLDTLLLSAAVHPVQQDHSMEAMARRLGIVIKDRHTALGDALSTAQLFLKLIPLLATQGIVTLKDARLVSEKTYYARLKY